jgi:hypothetical protein
MNTTHISQQPKAMLDAWLRLWNGDLSQAPGIISPDFRIHAALIDGGDSGSIGGVEPSRCVDLEVVGHVSERIVCTAVRMSWCET